MCVCPFLPRLLLDCFCYFLFCNTKLKQQELSYKDDTKLNNTFCHVVNLKVFPTQPSYDVFQRKSYLCSYHCSNFVFMFPNHCSVDLNFIADMVQLMQWQHVLYMES